ncbi:hypothetical protein AYO40_03560 [Planctomycetaceae bacterium SCGC AG-212-D15]|nr:hypothetical protein AYO40_03560 [Planctomycetaceae bacterium SCGC AG-212-D15]
MRTGKADGQDAAGFFYCGEFQQTQRIPKRVVGKQRGGLMPVQRIKKPKPPKCLKAVFDKNGRVRKCRLRAVWVNEFGATACGVHKHIL